MAQASSGVGRSRAGRMRSGSGSSRTGAAARAAVRSSARALRRFPRGLARRGTSGGCGRRRSSARRSRFVGSGCSRATTSRRSRRPGRGDRHGGWHAAGSDCAAADQACACGCTGARTAGARGGLHDRAAASRDARSAVPDVGGGRGAGELLLRAPADRRGGAVGAPAGRAVRAHGVARRSRRGGDHGRRNGRRREGRSAEGRQGATRARRAAGSRAPGGADPRARAERRRSRVSLSSRRDVGREQLPRSGVQPGEEVARNWTR